MIKKFYTYLIGWKSYDRWYYGVRYSSSANPDDLWKSYFTSSKHVKNFRKEYGEPDVVEIRQIFDTKISAISWEHKVLRRIGSVKSERWLNRFDGRSVHPDDALRGAMTKKPNRKPKSNEAKEKQRKLALEDKRIDRLLVQGVRRKSADGIRRHVKTLDINARISRTSAMNTQESRAKKEKTVRSLISNLSQKETDLRREAYAVAAKRGAAGSSYSAAKDVNRNEKIRKSKLLENKNFKEIRTCPNCGKPGQYAAMKRWHFDNCKTLSPYHS